MTPEYRPVRRAPDGLNLFERVALFRDVSTRLGMPEDADAMAGGYGVILGMFDPAASMALIIDESETVLQARVGPHLPRSNVPVAQWSVLLRAYGAFLTALVRDPQVAADLPPSLARQSRLRRSSWKRSCQRRRSSGSRSGSGSGRCSDWASSTLTFGSTWNHAGTTSRQNVSDICSRRRY